MTSSFPKKPEISNIPGPAATPVTHKRKGWSTAPIPICLASKNALKVASIFSAVNSVIVFISANQWEINSNVSVFHFLRIVSLS